MYMYLSLEDGNIVHTLSSMCAGRTITCVVQDFCTGDFHVHVSQGAQAKVEMLALDKFLVSCLCACLSVCPGLLRSD